MHLVRLSALLFAAANADDTCLEEASSLMQEAKKPVKTNRRDSKPLAGLLESAKGFLTNGVTPDVIDFADETLRQVQEIIIPTLEDEAAADQAWITSEYNRFQGVIDELVASNTAVYQWNIEEGSASTTHTTCREAEAAACGEKRRCEMELYGKWLDWVREEEELREIHAQIESHFCEQDEHGNYIANGTLHTFRVASVPWMTSYTEQKGDCDDAEGAYDVKVGECVITHNALDTRSAQCNADLSDLEGKACAHAAAIAENLRLFHTAWAALHASYQGITDLVYNQTQDRFQEYRTLIIVECLLGRVHELNGRPCDESTGTVDDQMTTCEEQGLMDICNDRPSLCPTFDPPPATPPTCADRNSVVGECLPDPVPWPCGSAWNYPTNLPVQEWAEQLATHENPHCNLYPDCSQCSDADDLSGDVYTDYQLWVEPPASFGLSHATFDATANSYADRYSLWAATVDGCSSDNSNSRDYMGDQTGQAIPLVVHSADETAAVRCCSHDGSTCVSQVQSVCHDVATFHDANAICGAAGMRLCTEVEMGSGICCGTGCWFNHFATWVSDGTPEAVGPEWTMAVSLTGTGTTVETDIGQAEFNRLFNACPVVKYTRNGGVHSVYKRRAGRPEVDAFALFTYLWANSNNQLGTDFDIYDSEADARSGSGAWSFCNYNDPDVGYPRDCGKNGAVGNTWFTMPSAGQHDANSGGGAQRFDIRNINAGASFEIYTGSSCP